MCTRASSNLLLLKTVVSHLKGLPVHLNLCEICVVSFEITLIILAPPLQNATQKLIRNLRCCFPGSQTVSWQSVSTSPKSTLHRGKGGGGVFGGSRDCQGMWLEIRHFSHLSQSETKLSNITDL